MLDRETAVRRLTARYEEQAERFPTLRNEITLALYIRRNVEHVRRNDLLESYEKHLAPPAKAC